MSEPGTPIGYRIFETETFQREMASLAGRTGDQIRRKLTVAIYPALRREPHFGPQIKKLRGWSPETWRRRVGPWRLFYEIDEGERIVFLLALHARKDAY